jgi:hypothetical protein
MHSEKEKKQRTKELHHYRKYVPEIFQLDMSLHHEASCRIILQGAVAERIEQPIVNRAKKAELLTCIDTVFFAISGGLGHICGFKHYGNDILYQNPRNRRA